MTFSEADSKAHEIVCRLIRLPRSKRAQKLATELRQLPAEARELMASYVSLLLADMEKQRGSSAIWSRISKMTYNQQIKCAGIGIGTASLLGVVALAVMLPSPTPFQYLVFRVVLSLGAAGYAMALAGLFEIKTRVGAFSVAATASFAVFFAVFLWNPPDLIFSEVRQDAQNTSIQIAK